jgi:hypothetical protein
VTVWIIRLRQISTGQEADSMLFRGTEAEARVCPEGHCRQYRHRDRQHPLPRRRTELHILLLTLLIGFWPALLVNAICGGGHHHHHRD